ncbi:unnamed protein product [Cochlearia groenlandica]
MSSNMRESIVGGRNIPAISHHRRGNIPAISDENLDLFSKIRRSFPSDESLDVSVGSKPGIRSKSDDLLSSAQGHDKNDYDWLLTPPGTPHGNDSYSSLEPTPRITSSTTRASSASKASSRLSVSQSETSYNTSRPSRSRSVTRPSSNYSSFSTSGRSPSSILNTSSASVSSYIRPSSPSSRSTSSARPSTPTRASTPSRIRPGSASSYVDKVRPYLSSRQQTPTSRPMITTNSSNTTASRPNSRPLTPTRRSLSTSVSTASGTNVSCGRVASSVRAAPSLSRPNSPVPRVRTTPQQPVDFPHDTPPNLRTTLPGRPISASRSRPVVSSTTTKSSPEPKATITRRNSSPIATIGRVVETQSKARFGSNGQQKLAEPRRISNVSEVTSRRIMKTSSIVTDNNNGIGRSLSKSSLDMAIKHMDIRTGKPNGCTLSTTTLFPQSIRQAGLSKIQPIRSGTNHSDSISSNSAENGNKGKRLMGKLSDKDMYESSRYDALLLKEDIKNTNWLHSIDDRSLDHRLGGFELLPEPFAPL